MLRGKKKHLYFLLILLQCYQKSIKLAPAWLECVLWFIFVWSCMVSLAKIVQFLILRCQWEIGCALLLFICLPFSFRVFCFLSDTGK